ncbi:FAD binding domain-containing protein [Chloroflexota bacterium]
MLTPTSEYFAPETMKEACSLLAKYKQQARVIAGGTDLLVKMKRKETLPRYIINISGVRDQDYITYDKKTGLRIGSATSIRSIELSPVIKEKFGLLAEASGMLGSKQVRNRATLAGNLCNAAPSAETAPPLMVLGATLKIMGDDGERTIPVEDFWTGPGQTVLKPDELLAEIQIPEPAPRSGGVYMAHGVRKAMEIAIVGVAVIVTLDSDVIKDVKIGLGAVAPTPIRARKAEEAIRGKKIDDDLLQKAGKNAAEECSCIDDIRSSAENRMNMVRVLVARAIKEAVARANKG